MAKVEKGDSVSWKWGSGTAAGKVTSVSTRKVTKTIKGSKVTRNGSKDDPALTIKQDDGDVVLKLASEVTAT